MLLCQLDLRPFDDPYPHGFWSRRTFLSGQASPQNRYRQYQKHFVHLHTSKKFARRTSQRRDALVLAFPPFRGLYHGIGLGPGTGAASQIADAQGGSGGVGMSNSLPWLAADPPIMEVTGYAYLSRVL